MATINCNELVELVTDYLEGRLSSVETARFERHLSTCQGCTNYVEQMRLTKLVVGHTKQELLTPQQCNELLKVFRNWKKG